jgi:hypothetical protein
MSLHDDKDEKDSKLLHALSSQQAWKDLYVCLCNILDTYCGIPIVGVHRLVMGYGRLPILLYLSDYLYMFDPVQNPQTWFMLVPNVPFYPGQTVTQLQTNNNYLYVLGSELKLKEPRQPIYRPTINADRVQTIYRLNLNSIVQFESKATKTLEWELFFRCDNTSEFLERFALWKGFLIGVRNESQNDDDGNSRLIFSLWNSNAQVIAGATEQKKLGYSNAQAIVGQRSFAREEEDCQAETQYLWVDHDTLWLASDSVIVESIQLTDVFSESAHQSEIFKSYLYPFYCKECTWYSQLNHNGFMFYSPTHKYQILFSFQTETWAKTSCMGSPGIQIDQEYKSRLCESRFNDSLFFSFHRHNDLQADTRGCSLCITNETEVLVKLKTNFLRRSYHLVYI